jgi:hypothetical protein
MLHALYIFPYALRFQFVPADKRSERASIVTLWVLFPTWNFNLNGQGWDRSLDILSIGQYANGPTFILRLETTIGI